MNKKFSKTKENREFVLCWATTPGHTPCWSCLIILGDTLLEKMDFFFLFVRRYQLQIVSWLGLRPVSTSPSQFWGPIWPEPVGVLCQLPLSNFICTSALLYLEGIVSFKSSTTSGSYNLSSIEIPKPSGFVKIPHVGLSAPKSLTLYMLSSCGSVLPSLQEASLIWADTQSMCVSVATRILVV